MVLGEDSGVTIGLVVLVIAGITGFWWRIEGRLTKQDEARSDLASELADYKLEVSKSYVSAAALKETEERLIRAIDKLVVKLETVVSRFDSFAIDAAANNRRRE